MNELKVFVIKMGSGRLVKISANNKEEAMMKLKMLLRSKKLFVVKNPLLKRGTIESARNLWRGRK